ncbi:MAG: bifunctional demethylmenaquinone methyltransferase/2-methoxy-6-polyprenyl-1,4-benzoquinol methylase UbiE [Polyangiales bacterium]
MSAGPPIPEVDRRAGVEHQHGDAVQAMFDRIAPTYDTVNRLLSLGIDVRWRRRAVRALEGAPEGEVLDLCAGTLDLSAEVERALPRRRVVAVDFAADMLARGRDKVRRTETVVGDAMHLPFADRRFAAAICGFGVRNLSDPRAGMAEAARVLVPGGRLVVLEFFRPAAGLAGAATRGFHAVYARGVLPTVGAIVARDRDAYAYLARSMSTFLTRVELETALRALGFVDVRGEDLTLGIASIVSATKGAHA